MPDPHNKAPSVYSETVPVCGETWWALPAQACES